MKGEVLDLVKFLSVPSAGVTATFAMVNQFLGTVAAILSIAFVIWKWRMDKKEYNKEKGYYEKNK
tara:strand:+ start:2966 stop:3160 length:195 start_codon:yes stop_codon:yes gene_type:complete